MSSFFSNFSVGKGRGKGNGEGKILDNVEPELEEDQAWPASMTDQLRFEVKTRDKYRCMICGASEIEVAHIIDESEQSDYQISWLRHTGISPGFVMNSQQNLITLCLSHRFTFNHLQWTLIPSQDDLKSLIDFEKADFEKREQLLSGGHFSARKVPDIKSLSGKCEYIYLQTPCAWNTHSHVGTCIEIVSNPLDHFPPEVAYSCHIGAWVEKPYVPFMLGVNTGIVFDLSVSQDGGRQLRVNPWALLCKAMVALNGTFCPADTSSIGLGPEPEPMAPRVQEAERLVLELRDLYNRVLVSSTVNREDRPSSTWRIWRLL